MELGPKGKRVAAVASDWPGLERGAKTGAAAVERLRAYVPRYAPVAALAGLTAEFAATGDPEVVEEYAGTGSTDFWGISFAFSRLDREPMSRDDLARELALMRASWAFLDQGRARVSAELRPGPRGGGRDRDRIARHVLGAEHDWMKKLELRPPPDRAIDAASLKAHRDAYCAAIEKLHTTGKPARSWPLRYLIRHTAFHALDHAWEMEDRDLTAERARGAD